MAKSKRIWRESQHPRDARGRFSRRGGAAWIKRAGAEIAAQAGSGETRTATGRPRISRQAKAGVVLQAHADGGRPSPVRVPQATVTPVASPKNLAAFTAKRLPAQKRTPRPSPAAAAMLAARNEEQAPHVPAMVAARAMPEAAPVAGANAYAAMRRHTLLALARDAKISIRGKTNTQIANELAAHDEKVKADRAAKLNPSGVGTAAESPVGAMVQRLIDAQNFGTDAEESAAHKALRAELERSGSQFEVPAESITGPAYVDVTGRDQFGSETNGRGFVNGVTRVNMRKRGSKKTTPALSFYITSTPNGANGSRHQVIVPEGGTVRSLPMPEMRSRPVDTPRANSQDGGMTPKPTKRQAAKLQAEQDAAERERQYQAQKAERDAQEATRRAEHEAAMEAKRAELRAKTPAGVRPADGRPGISTITSRTTNPREKWNLGNTPGTAGSAPNMVISPVGHIDNREANARIMNPLTPDGPYRYEIRDENTGEIIESGEDRDLDKVYAKANRIMSRTQGGGMARTAGKSTRFEARTTERPKDSSRGDFGKGPFYEHTVVEIDQDGNETVRVKTSSAAKAEANAVEMNAKEQAANPKVEAPRTPTTNRKQIPRDTKAALMASDGPLGRDGKPIEAKPRKAVATAPSGMVLQTFADRMRGEFSDAERLEMSLRAEEERQKLRAREAERAQQLAEARANDTRPEREKLKEQLEQDRAADSVDMRSGRRNPQRLARIKKLEDRIEELDTEDRKAKIKPIRKGDKVTTTYKDETIEVEVVGKTSDGYLRVLLPNGKRGSLHPKYIEGVTKAGPPADPKVEAPERSEAEIDAFIRSKGFYPDEFEGGETAKRQWVKEYEAQFGPIKAPNEVSKDIEKLELRIRGIELARESASLYGDSSGLDEDEEGRAKVAARKELADLKAKLIDLQRAERGYDSTPSKAFAGLSDAALDRAIKEAKPGTKKLEALRNERDARAAARFKAARPKADAAPVAAPGARISPDAKRGAIARQASSTPRDIGGIEELKPFRIDRPQDGYDAHGNAVRPGDTVTIATDRHNRTDEKVRVLDVGVGRTGGSALATVRYDNGDREQLLLGNLVRTDTVEGHYLDNLTAELAGDERAGRSLRGQPSAADLIRSIRGKSFNYQAAALQREARKHPGPLGDRLNQAADDLIRLGRGTADRSVVDRSLRSVDTPRVKSQNGGMNATAKRTPAQQKLHDEIARPDRRLYRNPSQTGGAQEWRLFQVVNGREMNGSGVSPQARALAARGDLELVETRPHGAEVWQVRARSAEGGTGSGSVPVGGTDSDRQAARPRLEINGKPEGDQAYAVRTAPSRQAALNLLNGHQLAGLRAIAREEGVVTSGTKADLVARLMRVMRDRHEDGEAIGRMVNRDRPTQSPATTVTPPRTNARRITPAEYLSGTPQRLTRDEKTAIDQWVDGQNADGTQMVYREIQQHLWTDGSLPLSAATRRHMENLRSAISRHTVPEDIVVSRYVNRTSLGLGPRGAGAKSVETVAGTTIRNKGFLAATLSDSIDRHIGGALERSDIKMNISVPKGTHAVYVDIPGNTQQELIMPPGTTLAIRSVSRGPGGSWEVNAEVVADAPATSGPITPTMTGSQLLAARRAARG